MLYRSIVFQNMYIVTLSLPTCFFFQEVCEGLRNLVVLGRGISEALLELLKSPIAPQVVIEARYGYNHSLNFILKMCEKSLSSHS